MAGVELGNIFIANRGEIAFRAAKTIYERSTRLKRSIVATVPDTFTDSNPLARRFAIAHLHEGWQLATLGGARQEQNFSNDKRLVNTALSGPNPCDSMFVGYGFNSERPELIQLCIDNRLVPIAPPPEAMRIGINKIDSRNSVQSTRYRGLHTIPIVPGTEHLKDLDEVMKAARDLGFPQYPVMGIDPERGGGTGHGAATNEAELVEVYEKLTGQPDNKQFFLERLIRNPLHVEVQIVADQHGNVVALGERDCTMQFHHQKVIEESPSPNISRSLANTLMRASIAHAKAIDYHSVGTWEFILDKDNLDKTGNPRWYFMEVNPRIQVEHTVTEEAIRIRDPITGELRKINIIDLMIDIAEGQPLPFTQKQVEFVSHAIQARVYSRNPDRNFEPIYGRVNRLWLPTMNNVRVDPAVDEGDELSMWFDETKLKAIAYALQTKPFRANDRKAEPSIDIAREQARETLVKFLSEAEIPESDTRARLQVLDSKEFRTGQGATTNTVEQINRRNLNERVRSIDSFIGQNGSFKLYDPTKRFVPGLMLQDPTVFKHSIDPETKEIITTPTNYSDYLENQKLRTKKESAANYGIVERDGIKFVLYHLEGSFGVQEGNVFEDANALAENQRIVLVSVVTETPGADQWHGNLSLHQMSRSTDALGEHKPKMHVVVLSGGVYGGVPSSFAGIGLKISVDGPTNNTGFSGPRLVLAETGKTPDEPGVKAAYEALRKLFPGAHSNLKHYQDRNHHILVHSLAEASDVVTNLIHTLPLPDSVTDRNYVYQPPQSVRLIESSGLAERPDRPGMSFPVLIGRFREGVERFMSPHHEEAYRDPLTVNQKMEVLMKAARYTGAEILDPRNKVVDRVALMASPPFQFKGELEQYPSIISGAVKIGHHDLFVIAQQTQRIWDSEKGIWLKKYVGQIPADWQYTEEMVETIARPTRRPILLLIDTNGADPSATSEAQNQSVMIARMLKLFSEYPYGVMSGLIGLKGSGGGETFGAPYDFSLSARNSLSFPATPMASYWMLSGLWVDGKATKEEREELARYIEQLKDATAEGRQKLKLTDEIVDEGPGGAHLHPDIFARNLRRAILKGLDIIESTPVSDLMRIRHERSQAPNDLVSVAY